MIVKADGTFEYLPEGKVDFEKVKEAIGGGYVEYVRIPGIRLGKLSLGEGREFGFYCDEDGKRKGLPFNLCASLLMRPSSVRVVGDVVVVTDDGEDSLALPHELQVITKGMLELLQQKIHESASIGDA